MHVCVCACVFVFGQDKERKKPYTIVLNMCEKCLPTLRYTHVCIISFLPFWYCYTQISCGSLACSQQIGLNTIKHIVPIVNWMPSSELGTLGTDAKKPNGSCPFFYCGDGKSYGFIIKIYLMLWPNWESSRPNFIRLIEMCVYMCVCVSEHPKMWICSHSFAPIGWLGQILELIWQK